MTVPRPENRAFRAALVAGLPGCLVYRIASGCGEKWQRNHNLKSAGLTGSVFGAATRDP